MLCWKPNIQQGLLLIITDVKDWAGKYKMAIIHFMSLCVMGSIKTLKHHQYQCLLVGESGVSTTNNIIININILHDQQQETVIHQPHSVSNVWNNFSIQVPLQSLSVTTMSELLGYFLWGRIPVFLFSQVYRMLARTLIRWHISPLVLSSLVFTSNNRIGLGSDKNTRHSQWRIVMWDEFKWPLERH